MNKDDVAIRKRSQISKANRTMFLWITFASVIVGAASVVSFFLFQKLVLNEKVLAEKQNTAMVLAQNNVTIKDLQDEIKILDTNTDLASVKANQNDRAIQVILDALPSDANSLALGASLQNKLLSGISGLTIETLRVEPVLGIETQTDSGALGSGTPNSIGFQFSVSGTQDNIKQVLLNLEKSIRTINVTSLQIDSQNNKQVMNVRAEAYYEPRQTLELTEKKVSL